MLLANHLPQGSAQAFDTLPRLVPPIAEAAIELVASLIQLEDWENARSVLESALQQAPDDASLYNNLGVVYQAQGEKELARQMFEKAIQLRPDWGTPQENLLKLTEE